MRRVFRINEVIWWEADHMRGWGTIALINGSDTTPDYPCSDDDGDILTIKKEDGGEIQISPSQCYQVAHDKHFRGRRVVYEHNTGIDYPLYCPEEDENLYYIELD